MPTSDGCDIGVSSWTEARPATSGGGNVGVIFRASDLRGGPDGYNGYFAGLDSGGGGKVLLGRANGGWRGLHHMIMSVRQGQIYRVKVRAVGDSIQVYVDDMDQPKLAVRDGTFRSGLCGVRVYKAGAEFDNIKIR